MKVFANVIKTLLIILFIFLFTQKASLRVSKVSNNNLNKSVDLSTMAKKVDEFNYNDIYGAIDTYTGDLTGYVYNCPLCTGHLACLSSLDLSGGNVSFDDEIYGNVRIVASSSNLPCGTIIRFNSSRISDGEVLAIVLDRGVRGNDIDLLVESTSYAISTVGRSSITYDVLRSGW